MPSLPPPARAAVGLAARTLEEARRLPQRLLSIPVVAAGAAMQVSLRLQQEYAGLVARGDELILRYGPGPDDTPPWATFDDAPPTPDEPLPPPLDVLEPDDLEGPPADAVAVTALAVLDAPVIPLDPPAVTAPTTRSSRRRHTDLDRIGRGTGRAAVTPFLTPAGQDSAFDRVAEIDETAAAEHPPVAGYDAWSLAQLRARLRQFSVDQLSDLLAYEEGGRARPAFLTMLQNRLAAAERP